ncbi:unnamed protein product [Caenorhabditis sp. 36 PRJEB53466]|nr:unnamed protein product [Caenorhabditis sp. 36 PRJEB53466]
MFSKLLVVCLLIRFSTPYCEQRETTEDCAKILKALNVLFETKLFGSPEYYVIPSAHLNSSMAACGRFKSSVPSDLPRMDYSVFCKKVRLLTSPFGDCMRKMHNNKGIESELLESFVNDYTNYGLSRKCLILSDPLSRVHADISKECGSESGEAFRKATRDLKTFFDLMLSSYKLSPSRVRHAAALAQQRLLRRLRERKFERELREETRKLRAEGRRMLAEQAELIQRIRELVVENERLEEEWIARVQAASSAPAA